MGDRSFLTAGAVSDDSDVHIHLSLHSLLTTYIALLHSAYCPYGAC